MDDIQAAFTEHSFLHLFIESLDWDRFNGKVPIGGGDGDTQLIGVAQKRCFCVFVCCNHPP